MEDGERRRVLQLVLESIAALNTADIWVPVGFVAQLCAEERERVLIDPDEFGERELKRAVHRVCDRLTEWGELVDDGRLDMKRVKLPHVTLARELSRCGRVLTGQSQQATAELDLSEVTVSLAARLVGWSAEKDPEVWRLLWTISLYQTLAESDGVRKAVSSKEVLEAVARAVRESDEPWRVLWAVRRWRKVRASEEVLAAVREAVPRIARAVRGSDEPWRVLQAVGEWPEVWQSREVAAAAHGAAPAIAHSIREEHPPDWLLDMLRHWPQIREHPDVRDALRKWGIDL